jgi:hypothetical protein
LCALWPKDLGFSAGQTSTEYFRFLMANSNGAVTARAAGRTGSGISPALLAEEGVPVAATSAAFSPQNNAWSVLCIGSDAPAETPFLISRNVDWGPVASTSAVIRLKDERPFRCTRAVWVTRGGTYYSVRLLYLNDKLCEAIGTNRYDVLYP